jgi:hypothetical protein
MIHPDGLVEDLGITMSIDPDVVPSQYALHANYPNPFNIRTHIKYDLPEVSDVQLVIYKMLGQQVKTLVSQRQFPGFKSVVWNGTNDRGKPVSAGVYLYQIHAKGFSQTRKMILLK